MSKKKSSNSGLKKGLKGILAKPAKLSKSPKKLPPMKERRRRWKLVDGVMVEMGSD